MTTEDSLENKIRAKAESLLKGYEKRKTGASGYTEGSRKTYMNDTVLAMLKIIKKEVNIRLQEIKHTKGGK